MQVSRAAGLRRVGDKSALITACSRKLYNINWRRIFIRQGQNTPKCPNNKVKQALTRYSDRIICYWWGEHYRTLACGLLQKHWSNTINGLCLVDSERRIMVVRKLDIAIGVWTCINVDWTVVVYYIALVFTKEVNWYLFLKVILVSILFYLFKCINKV